MPTKGFKSAANTIERMSDEIEHNATRAAERQAVSIAAEMKENVIAQDAVGSTELFRGIGVLTGAGATPWSSAHIVIESSAPHSGFVEFGTGPQHRSNRYTRRYGTPDLGGDLVANLVKWAELKPSLHVDNPIGFAWAVGQNISGNNPEVVGGTAPQPFFIPAWEANKKRLKRIVKFAVQRATRV